jgi:hypothetical protein
MEISMRSQLPSQSLVWGVLPRRFESELTVHKLEICRLYGLSEEVGPAGGKVIDEREGREIIDELTGVLLRTVALDAEARQRANSSGRGVGRPCDVMIPYLALELLSVYRRYHDSGGRQSAATSIDGKPAQKEGGRFFEFIKATIEPLNHYLTTELHRRPLSASRLARFALSEHRRKLRAARWRQLTALVKRQPSP